MTLPLPFPYQLLFRDANGEIVLINLDTLMLTSLSRKTGYDNLDNFTVVVCTVLINDSEVVDGKKISSLTINPVYLWETNQKDPNYTGYNLVSHIVENIDRAKEIVFLNVAKIKQMK